MPDPVRFYLDEDTISRALMSALSARGVDILSAHVAGLVAVPDNQHLEYAASLRRVLFTSAAGMSRSASISRKLLSSVGFS